MYKFCLAFQALFFGSLHAPQNYKRSIQKVDKNHISKIYRNFPFNEYQEIKKGPRNQQVIALSKWRYFCQTVRNPGPTARSPAQNGATKTEVCWTNNLVYIMKFHFHAHRMITFINLFCLLSSIIKKCVNCDKFI